MARKTGQIIGRAPRTWVVRVYVGRDAETKKRKYLNKTIHGGLRDAQAHLNRMLGERDLGRNLDSSKQTLNQYLDRWLEVCAKPRLRAKGFSVEEEGLLRRYVRPQLGTKPLVSVQAFDIQSLYRSCWMGARGPIDSLYPCSTEVCAQTGGPLEALLAKSAELVDLPRHTRRGDGVLSVEQARASWLQ